ncbi:hypothetical protein [Burkholderia glumae]|uniref:hypothetical protein n=2 Tax=Burkholderia glumae TaxID=337 RepID=UPI00031C3BB1|nr:hypothetical protein [Burkholderia glumae]PJO21424.1 hypothetical protein Y5A_019725 [Burkholderia glumae AU6208]QHE13826.1 hypothetical protein GQR88_26965 [Burkholderia glumae AU6208]
MGMRMQIAYFGFAGSARLEAEAAIQSRQLERFGARWSGCYLAIESCSRHAVHTGFDVRLDLIGRDGRLLPLPHVAGPDPVAALRCAFDGAVQRLRETEAGRPDGPPPPDGGDKPVSVPDR